MIFLSIDWRSQWKRIRKIMIHELRGYHNGTSTTKVGLSLRRSVSNSSHDHTIRDCHSTVWVRSPQHRRRCQKRECWPWPTNSKDGSLLPRSWASARLVGWSHSIRLVALPVSLLTLRQGRLIRTRHQVHHFKTAIIS